jgi:hypothetical protein
VQSIYGAVSSIADGGTISDTGSKSDAGPLGPDG